MIDPDELKILIFHPGKSSYLFPPIHPETGWAVKNVRDRDRVNRDGVKPILPANQQSASFLRFMPFGIETHQLHIGFRNGNSSGFNPNRAR
jgi:hypothetical protein